MPRAGTPRTTKARAVDHHVVDRGFEEVGGELPGLLEHVDGRAADRAARELERARARRARAALDEVGVAFDHLDVVDHDRERLAPRSPRTARACSCPADAVPASTRTRAVGEHRDARGLLPRRTTPVESTTVARPEPEHADGVAARRVRCSARSARYSAWSSSWASSAGRSPSS